METTVSNLVINGHGTPGFWMWAFVHPYLFFLLVASLGAILGGTITDVLVALFSRGTK